MWLVGVVVRRYRKSLNRSLPQIEACLKLTPGVLQISVIDAQGGSDKLSQLRNNHMTFWFPITFRFRLARACVYTAYRVSISHLD